MSVPPSCARCGHLPISHRRGRCEHVKREGWIPQHSTFTKETPCTCEGWQDAKPAPKKPKP